MDKAPKQYEKIEVRLNPLQKAQLEALAKDQGKSRSQVMAEAFSAYIDKLEKDFQRSQGYKERFRKGPP